MVHNKRILLGKIVGLFGVRGGIKLESYTDPREAIFSYQPWQIKVGSCEKEIGKVAGQSQGKGLIAFLPDIINREQADEWVGAEIWVDRALFPEPEQGEYYWADLEGLEVITEVGISLGRVAHLFSTGANDVMVTRTESQEHLVPFILDHYVRKVDLEAGHIIVDWDPNF